MIQSLKRLSSDKLLLGQFIIILMLSAINIVSYSEIKRLHDQQNKGDKCLSEYIRKDHEATKARVLVGEADRVAFNTLVLNAGTTKTEAEQIKIYETYINTVKESNKRRLENPLPEPPNSCEEK